MTIEQGGNPVFGEDNLPDPWSSQIIRRVQQGFSAVLVADKDYWEANKMSNANGDWPSSIPARTKGATRATTLLIFNDTFAGTSIDVNVEALVKEGVTDENRSKVVAAIRKHVQVIESLRDKVA